MDDSGHRENGRHKPLPGQWLMQQQQQHQHHHQPSMKQIMAIMAERDAAIQERNLAMSEKKAALAERDMAILQRDAAITERNNAFMERDNAIATLQYRENSINSGNMSPSPCPPGCQISRGVKHIHHPQQYIHHQHQHQHQHQPHLTESPQQSTKELNMDDCTLPLSPVAQELPKPKRNKRTKEPKMLTDGNTNKKTPKAKRVKKEADDLNKTLFDKSNEWKGGHEMGIGIDDLNRQLGGPKPDWKDQDLGLNQVVFDETTMPVPVCSCTGTIRPCYKWGNGGWQSSCCTTTMSMYPLPSVPNKRHARVGGRKMSGGAFNKLLSRLAGQGHDLSNAVDLKDHWAKHGTNRYITIK